MRGPGPPPLGGPGDEYPVGIGIGIGITHTASRSRSRMTRGGLDRAVLDSFPTIAYADAKAHSAARSSGALECAVCLSEFEDDKTLRLLLPGCAHADCTDAWLTSHVTCPICRAVLAPEPPATAVPATEHDDLAVPAAPRHPASMASPEQASVVIDVVAAARETEEQRIRTEEAAELMRIGSVKRALRCKSGRRPAREGFPRSHTTGHSLAAPSPSPSPSPSTSDSERYTLRLPEHVLREVVAAGNLRRSASIQTTRSSGRWPNMSVLARTFSARLPAWGSVRRRESDAPPKGAKFAGGSDGKAVEQCDGGAFPLGAHV